MEARPWYPEGLTRGPTRAHSVNMGWDMDGYNAVRRAFLFWSDPLATRTLPSFWGPEDFHCFHCVLLPGREMLQVIQLSSFPIQFTEMGWVSAPRPASAPGAQIEAPRGLSTGLQMLALIMFPKDTSPLNAVFIS